MADLMAVDNSLLSPSLARSIIKVEPHRGGTQHLFLKK